MNQQDFEQRNEAIWTTLDAQIDALSRKKTGDTINDSAEFPRLYRQVCHHLAIARERLYTTHLIDRLNQLMIRGHQYLYSVRAGSFSHVMRFLGGGFPALIRSEWRLFLLAFGLSLLPGIIMGVSVYFWPQMIYTLVDAQQVAMYDWMYSPEAPHVGRERGSDDDMLMFGFYVRHNTSIDLQTFAGGIVFGLGSIFFLMFNGLHLGAISGYLTQRGYVENFWSFVIGHGAFELTALVFSGMAGLKLGMALLAPGRRTRSRALIESAHVAIKIMYGVIGMSVIAAFIEAFWSSSKLFDPSVKFIVGGLLWLLVIAYFVLVGRKRYAN